MFSESIAFKSVVAFTAVEVVRRDQHAIAGNDHNTSFVQSSAEVFADLIELTHEVLDLLFAEHELLAVADAVTEGKFDGGLADAALRDARSVVVGFCQGQNEPCTNSVQQRTHTSTKPYN